MDRGRTIIILRSAIAGLLICLAIAGFAAGRPVIGLLFAALAGTNIWLTVTMHRHRKDLEARFPGLAARRAGGAATPSPATPAAPVADV
jgi:hypothetical protein